MQRSFRTRGADETLICTSGKPPPRAMDADPSAAAANPLSGTRMAERIGKLGRGKYGRDTVACKKSASAFSLKKIVSTDHLGPFLPLLRSAMARAIDAYLKLSIKINELRSNFTKRVFHGAR